MSDITLWLETYGPTIGACLTVLAFVATPALLVWGHKRELDRWSRDAEAWAGGGASSTGARGAALLPMINVYQGIVMSLRPTHEVWVQVVPRGQGHPALDLDVPPDKTRHARPFPSVYLYRWRFLSRLFGYGHPIYRILVRPHDGDPTGAHLLAEELAHVDQAFRTGRFSVARGSVAPGEDLDLAGQAFRDELIQRAGLGAHDSAA